MIHPPNHEPIELVRRSCDMLERLGRDLETGRPTAGGTPVGQIVKIRSLLQTAGVDEPGSLIDLHFAAMRGIPAADLCYDALADVNDIGARMMGITEPVACQHASVCAVIENPETSCAGGCRVPLDRGITWESAAGAPFDVPDLFVFAGPCSGCGEWRIMQVGRDAFETCVEHGAAEALNIGRGPTVEDWTAADLKRFMSTIADDVLFDDARQQLAGRQQ